MVAQTSLAKKMRALSDCAVVGAGGGKDITLIAAKITEARLISLVLEASKGIWGIKAGDRGIQKWGEGKMQGRISEESRGPLE
jgi:hypothetical protein